MTNAKATKRSGLKGKAKPALVYKCADIKAAIAKELRSHIKDKAVRDRLVEVLGGEVAYNTGGGGGGVGVA
jgi:hypothetical protein